MRGATEAQPSEAIEDALERGDGNGVAGDPSDFVRLTAVQSPQTQHSEAFDTEALVPGFYYAPRCGAVDKPALREALASLDTHAVQCALQP